MTDTRNVYASLANALEATLRWTAVDRRSPTLVRLEYLLTEARASLST